jgi:hypothetical protein
LIERPELATALEGIERVGVVHGPSGAGKSTLLRQGCDIAAAGSVVAGPLNMAWSDEIAAHLLDAMGDAVGQLIEERGIASQVGERLNGTLERLVESKGKALIGAAWKEVLAAVRHKVSPEAGQALAEAVTALREEETESLAARLDRERPPLQREIVVEFAREVVALAEGRKVIVALDRCERLNEGSLRLLADLVEDLPPGMAIWAAMTDGPSTELMCDLVGAEEVQVPPLAQQEVANVLDAESQPAELAEELRDRSSGNALELRAYVGLLERGQPFDVDGGEALRRITMLVLDGVSADAQKLALRTAILSDPLPTPRLAELAELGIAETEAALEELKLAGLVFGWFHERQREILVSSLSATERERVAADAAAIVLEHISTSPEGSWLVELVRLVRQAPEVVAESPGVGSVLELNPAELGVLAGLIELSPHGPENPDIQVSGDQLLMYARAMFPSGGDLIAALETLSERGLADVFEIGERPPMAVPRVERLASVVAQGRAIETIGVRPVPGIARRAFLDAIIPKLGEPRQSQFGVGQASMRLLSYGALGRADDTMYSPSHGDRTAAKPAVLMRARFAGRPLYGIFDFSSPGERDEAMRALDGLKAELLGAEMEVTATLAYPTQAVPSDRFLRAAEVVVGKDLRSTSMYNGAIREKLAEPLSLEDRHRLRIETRASIREISDAVERAASRTDLGLEVFWAQQTDHRVEAWAIGGADRATESKALLDLNPSDPWGFFHMEAALDLPPGASIMSVNHSVGPSVDHDPMLEELGRLSYEALRFNRAQRPRPIGFDARLPEELCEAYLRRRADARFLAEKLPLASGAANGIEPSTLYALIISDPKEIAGETSWVPGARSQVLWAEAASAGDADECHVTHLSGEEHFALVEAGAPAALRRFDDFDESRLTRSGWSQGHSFLAKILGYREEDLDFMAHLAMGIVRAR